MTSKAAKIAICTANSNSGKACIQKLSAMGVPSASIRGCFRTQDKAQSFLKDHFPPSSTLDTYVGLDAANMSSLREAFQQCDRALIVTPLDHAVGFEKDAQNSINMIQAAVDCGVKRIVHVGSWTVHYPKGLPILSARFSPTEDYLRSQVGDAVEWSVLRGGYFMSNLLSHAESVRSKGMLNPVPHVHIPAVDTRDIGEAAAMLLSPSGSEEKYPFHGKFIECCGPQLLSNSDLAQIIGEVIGSPVDCPDSPDLDEWCRNGVPPIFVELFQHMVKQDGKGIPYDDSLFTSVLGRAPRTFREFVQDHEVLFLN